MKQCIKIIGFIMVMSAIVVFSEQMQHHIIESYNHYVNQLATRTISSTHLKGI